MPPSVAALPKDRRGLPIPVTVSVDGAGVPNFAMTDHEARHRMLGEDRCQITGKKLLRGRWLIGGPLPAFHETGAFLDGPMLDEASLYAVRVCPYIAARHYGGLGAAAFGKPGDGTSVAMKVTENVDERPDLFVRLMAVGHRLFDSGTGDVVIVPKRPYRAVEFWRHGEMLGFDEGVALSVSSPLSQGLLTERMVLAACGRR